MIRKAVISAVLICSLLPLGAAAQIMIGGGTLRYEPKGAAPVVFNHEKHLAANEHRCSFCHFGVFLMEKGSLKMNMDKMTKGNFAGPVTTARRPSMWKTGRSAKSAISEQPFHQTRHGITGDFC
jgi:c(7)-type cytochrome triheme protein